MSAAPTRSGTTSKRRHSSTVVFTVQPVGWVGDWHENPAPQWIVVLSGRWWIESMDGTRIEQGPGEFSFGEDQGCTKTDGRQGHRSGTIGDAARGADDGAAARRSSRVRRVTSHDGRSA